MKLLDHSQGNILSLYWIWIDSLFLYEIPLYGSSRLGVIKENKLLKVKTAQNTIGVMSLPIPVNIAQSKNTTKPSVYTMGKKHYESTDWLGNVRVTYTDKKSWQQNKFALNVSSSLDYYPFGSVMEGRNLETIDYRFGFQGQEGDDEVFGTNNLWAYKYRLHDARLGRFFSVDPLAGKYPYNSVYAFSENRVIDGVELEGLEASKNIVVDPESGKTKITITVDIQVKNSSKMISDKEAIAYTIAIMSQVVKTYSGKIDAKTEVYFDYRISNVGVDENNNVKLEGFDTDNAFYIEFVDEVQDYDGSENMAGKVDKIGDPIKNRFQIRVKSFNNPKLLRSVNAIKRTGAHEFGHGLGLRHPWDPLNKANDVDQKGKESGYEPENGISKETIIKNIMNSG